MIKKPKSWADFPSYREFVLFQGRWMQEHNEASGFGEPDPTEDEIYDLGLAWEGGAQYLDGWGAWSRPSGLRVDATTPNLGTWEDACAVLDGNVREYRLHIVYLGGAETWGARLVWQECDHPDFRTVADCHGDDPELLARYLVQFAV
jgi:hypothetical protein